MCPLLPLGGTDELDSSINCLFHELALGCVMALGKYMQIYANEMQINTKIAPLYLHIY